MSRKTNRAVKRINQAQADKAERFRFLLTEYNTLTGKEREFFNNFVDNLDTVQLTNLARQYRAPLETYYDSQGVTTILAHDVLKRVQGLISSQAGNVYAAAEAVIFAEDTRKDIQTVSARIFAAYSRYRELREIEDTRIRQEIGLYEELWERARTEADRRLVIEAAEGKVWYMSNREFFKHFRVGKAGVKRYRGIILNVKEAQNRLNQE